MDIEELNKSQIVMLTLLVSFVTSIATGIVTVSLMDQAPPTVTQTINRVVERTIERVVPQETQTATVITQERTVVVRESELIAQAVDRVSPSLVSVLSVTEEGKSGDFLSRGVVAAPNVIVTTISNPKVGGEYYITLSDKKVALGKVLFVDEANSLTLLSYKMESEDSIAPAAFVTTAPKLGQTVVALTGVDKVKVASGLVTGFIDVPVKEDEDAPKTETQTAGHLFETNIAQSALVRGSIIINTDGAVIGVSQGGSSGVTSAASVLSSLAAAEKASSTTESSTTAE